MGAFQIDVLHCHPDQGGGIENAINLSNFDLVEKSTALKYSSIFYYKRHFEMHPKVLSGLLFFSPLRKH